MQLNSKILRVIYRESMSTMFIIITILIIGGGYKHKPSVITISKDIVIVDSGELPSQDIHLEEAHVDVVSIEQLVADVDSGKAGNGDARREYLGKYYDEVQSIINNKYKNITNESEKKQNSIRSVSGAKSDYQTYAYELVKKNGWSDSDFQALINLWDKESGWNPNAHNKSSGAHGIPQSLPASKMSSHGEDYYTNGYTQIRWGIDYISNRYGSPTAAWNHFLAKNWY